MKRGITAENYSHVLTNVALTPRLMTQQQIARARTLGASSAFTENIRIWCTCVQTQTLSGKSGEPNSGEVQVASVQPEERPTPRFLVWEWRIACMHQLLSGFIDIRAINHQQDLQLGYAGANAFFKKVDIWHTWALRTRVSPTLAYVNLCRLSEEKLYISESHNTHEITQVLLTQGLCARCWSCISITPDCLFVLFDRSVHGKYALILSV